MVDAAEKVTVTVRACNPADVPAVWPAVAPLLQTAIERTQGERELEDVRDYIDAGDATLVVCEIAGRIWAAAVLLIVDYERMRGLRVWLMGGHDREHWRGALLDGLDEIARLVGADRVEVGVRRGLIPILNAAGYGVAYTEMVKMIQPTAQG